MYKIDKNIKIPPQAQRGEAPKYPFKKMKIGDSFFIPNSHIEENRRTARRIISAGVVYKKRNSLTQKDFKLTTRIYEDGVRCWRTK